MATIAFALGWELLYQLVKRLVVARSSHEKVRDYGASYAVAFIHAAFVSALGAAHFIAMRDLPESSKAVVDPDDPHYEQSRTMSSPTTPCAWRTSSSVGLCTT